MEADNLEALQKMLEAEQNKNKNLQDQLRIKDEESQRFVNFTQKHQLLQGASGVSTDLARRLRALQREKELFLSSLEREEETITNIIYRSLEKLMQDQNNIEHTLNQEQEEIINAMSKQLAQEYTEQEIFELRFRTDAQNRSRSVSDVDSTKEGENTVEDVITDSSFSSDSESAGGFISEEKRKIRIMESDLQRIKQQMRMAKREVRKYKHMYEKMLETQQRLMKENYDLGQKIAQSEGEGDTDRSDLSFESCSSRSVGWFDGSQELPPINRKDIIEPKKK